MAVTSLGRAGGRSRPLRNRLKPGDWLFTALTGAAALIIIGIIGGLFYELTDRSWDSITANGFSFVWGTEWDPAKQVFGVWPFILGTFITSVFALVFATVIGVLVALFLVEIAPGYISRPVSYLVELLAAIPSVVYGLWGIYVMGVFIRDDFGPWLTDTFGWIPCDRRHAAGDGAVLGLPDPHDHDPADDHGGFARRDRGGAAQPARGDHRRSARRAGR